MTNGTTGLPVLIAGGGIGGLAAALALAKKGIRSHVVEQAPEFGEVGAGIQIGPNVFRMFDKLGLTEAINKVAVFPENLIMMDSITGKEVARMPLGATAKTRFGYPYGVIYRPDLLDVILDACRQQELITLSTGQKITGYQDLGSHVELTTETGATFEGAALVGADGLWSTIREGIVGDGKPKVSGHIAYRAVLPTPEVPDEIKTNNVVLWAGPKSHLVHYPLRRGEIYNFVAVFHSDRYEEGWNTFGDVDELNAKFAPTCDAVKQRLALINQWKMWVLCDREPIKEWTRGNVTLLGDAAHPMLQYLAAGAGMAIEDGYVLANKIEARGGDYANAFLDYQQERYLRTGRVQITARVYGILYHAGGVAAELRNMLLANPSSAGGMGWLYDGIN